MAALEHDRSFRQKSLTGMLQTECGAALIAVLWILSLMSIMALGYATDTRLRSVTAASQVAAVKKGYQLDSALLRGQYEYDKYVLNRALFLRRAEVETLTGQKVELWYPRYEPYLLAGEQGEIAVQVRNAGGRFNVNRLPSALWDSILLLCGVADEGQRMEIRDAVLDWIDADDLHHLQGVEAEHYLGLSPEYYCKNNNIQVIDELLLVRGISPDLYYGNDQHPGLVDFLSVYGALDKLDINSAAPGAFQLLEGLSESELAEIIAYRRENPFQKLSDLSQLLSVETYAQVSRYFTILDSPSYVTISVSTWPTETAPVAWLHRTFEVQ